MDNKIEFDINNLGEELKKAKEVDFAYIFGSAQTGVVKAESDIDIAVYLNCKASLNIYMKLMSIVENSLKVRSDISVLNTASAILAMEALQGQLLFYKKNKQKEYVDFYSYTCRKYEDEIFWMKKQLEYRGY